MKKEIKNRIDEFEKSVNERVNAKLENIKAGRRLGGIEMMYCPFYGDTNSENRIYMTTSVLSNGETTGYDFYVRLYGVCVFSSFSSENSMDAFKKMRNEFYKFVKKFIKECGENDEYSQRLLYMKSLIEG